MENKNNKDELVDILKETNNQIQPQDSWQDLRNRIDEKIKNGVSSTLLQLNGNIVFWRRTALTAVACLVITTVLLVYVLYNNNSNQPLSRISNNHLLQQSQLKQLSQAFSQVQDLFNQSCPWMVINSGGNGEIGVDNKIIETVDDNKLIVLRLAVNMEDNESLTQYLDVVTYPNQLVSFNMSVANDINMYIILRSTITKTNTIKVEVNAEIDSGLKADNIITIADNIFTTLVRLESNGSQINIDATGLSIANI